jgi:hypothetical protein
MRNWLFHPLVFYPLVILIAAVAILASLEPQNWTRAPAPAMSQHSGQSLVWSGVAFNSPDVSSEQRLTVQRDLWGNAQSLRIAVVPHAAQPGPDEEGVRVLLSADDAAAISGKPVTVEVTYTPLPVNAASGLAVSLQGADATKWVQHDAPSPPQGALRFELPAQSAPQAIGLRVLSGGQDENYGLEITRIKLTPHA